MRAMRAAKGPQSRNSHRAQQGNFSARVSVLGLAPFAGAVVLAASLGGVSGCANRAPVGPTETITISVTDRGAIGAGSVDGPTNDASIPPPALLDPSLAPQTDSGAATFTRAWFTALNQAFHTGNAALVTAATGPDCTACAEYLAQLASVTATGGRLDADPFSVNDVRAENAETEVAVASFTYEVHAVAVVAEGAPRDPLQGEPTTRARAVLTWEGDHWVMGEIGL